jgi:hypothetical protein
VIGAVGNRGVVYCTADRDSSFFVFSFFCSSNLKHFRSSAFFHLGNPLSHFHALAILLAVALWSVGTIYMNDSDDVFPEFEEWSVKGSAGL